MLQMQQKKNDFNVTMLKIERSGSIHEQKRKRTCKKDKNRQKKWE